MQFVQGGPPGITDFGGNSPGQQGGVVRREPSSNGLPLYERRVTIGGKQVMDNNFNNRDCEVFQVLKSKLVEMDKAEVEIKTLKS